MTPTSYDDQTGTFDDYVVFDIERGDAINESRVAPPESASGDAYVFTGWSELPNDSEVSFPYHPSGTQYLYASFTPIK